MVISIKIIISCHFDSMQITDFFIRILFTLQIFSMGSPLFIINKITTIVWSVRIWGIISEAKGFKGKAFDLPVFNCQGGRQDIIPLRGFGASRCYEAQTDYNFPSLLIL